MKRFIWMIVVVCSLFLGIFGGSNVKALKAQVAQPPEFSHIVPFSTSGGNLGFFDQKVGRVYVYDQNLKDCIYQIQLTELGQPLIKAEKQSQRQQDRFGVGY